MKTGIFAGIALAIGTLSLSACGSQDTTPTTVAKGPAVTVTNARLALPPVKGNPGAVYFDLANTGTSDVAFRTADVAGASSSMMHVTNGAGMDDLMLQPVKAGETVKFEPGSRHVMAMDLADTLKAGGTTDVTLHFSNGDKITFPAKIIAPGEDR